MKQKRKVISILLTMTMLGSMAIACSNKTDPAASAPPAPAQQSGAATYPLKTDKTLTYWSELNSAIATIKPTFDQVPFFQEWQKRTGVKLKFTQPPANQVKESLNVMLASGDLPDMIEYDWFSFPGGPEKAIADGYILKLNDAIDKYAPNLKKYLKEHPEVDKMVKTDSGSYFEFPFIRGDESLMVYQGPIVRKDWLDELGLPVPVTIDDWYTMLKAFKEKKGATAPFTVLSAAKPLDYMYQGAFFGAFGVKRDFYQENGQVKFGPMQPGYKDFLTTFHKWYSEGLIDKNIATVDQKALDANMTTGASGATVQNTGAGIGKWTPTLQDKDPKAMLVAAPYPVLKKGDTPKFGQKDFAFSLGNSVAISGKSKNVELAARMLDYGYSDEGHMYFNFGQEGVSYKLDKGEPVYTDLLMKNPDKLPPSQAMALYIRGNSGGTFVQDKRYIMQYLALPQQRAALDIWKKTDVDKYIMPLVTATPAESSELAKIMNDVNTLMDEMTLKIILGSEPVDAYDKYMDKLKSLKIDRAIEIEKAALDRYNKR